MLHIDCLLAFDFLALARAVLNACPAACAVFRSYLNCKLHALEVFALGINALECLRCVFQIVFFVCLNANSRMRTHQRTLAALNTQFRLPYRDVHSNIAFLIFGCSCGEFPVHRHLAHWHAVALAGENRCKHFLNEFRCVVRYNLRHLFLACCIRGHVNLLNAVYSSIYCIRVHLNDFFALLAVSLLDSVFDCINRFFSRYNFADLEECCLHYDVDSRTEPELLCNADSVDYVEIKLLVYNLLLHLLGQCAPYIRGIM
ncbi:hypothetical protein SMSP1_00060 [Sedimentisphaera salicampi]|nr:hypothetical protein SMSP1_00060 [Sedimentisphaera salicampi]